MFVFTRELAPITDPLPTLTPFKITALVPIQQSLPISTGSIMDSWSVISLSLLIPWDWSQIKTFAEIWKLTLAL